MALVSRDRMSPLHAGLHHHVPGLHYGYNTKKPRDVLSKASIDDVFAVSFDDDDDFSDHDSHYSEDEIDTIPLSFCHAQFQHAGERDVTQRLLNFVDMVNSDIQKFFGRRKDEEDSCDIYEEKWTSGKSGRELYYADLLKIAQGGDGERPRKSNKSTSPQSATETVLDNRDKFSGTMDKKVGLGPLNELFEYGLRNILHESNGRNGRGSAKRLKVDHNKNSNTVPMSHRKLPESFWREPGVNSDMGSVTPSVLPTTALHPNKPPDFSDLLHHWTGGATDTSEFHNLSPSEISMTSPESP